MSINYNPKVGEVLQCDFGDDYPRISTGEPDTSSLTSNNRLPPEMVKNRLVVILNGKMTGGCLVVPISATKSQSTTTSKYHVSVDSKLIQGHDYFDSNTPCWALGEQVQQVSKRRLRRFYPDPSMSLVIPSELVTQIQRAVIKAINAGSLLADATVTAPTNVPEASPYRAPQSAFAAAMEVAKKQHPPAQPPAAPTGRGPDQLPKAGPSNGSEGKEAA